MEGICLNCGASFQNKSGQPKGRPYQKFCSVECAKKNFIKNHAICAKCGKRHVSNEGDLCSRCKVRAMAHSDRKAVCARCGNEFITNNSRVKFCSEECRKVQALAQKSNSDKNRGLRIKMVGRMKGPYDCAVCGVEFYTEYGDKHKKYCSESCSAVAASERQSFVKRKRDLKIKVKCKNGTYRDPISLKRLYLRDGGICQICHKKIKWELQRNGPGGPDPMSATRDHIIPVSCGGDHSWENVRLAHFSCNCQRGTGGTAQVLLFG